MTRLPSAESIAALIHDRRRDLRLMIAPPEELKPNMQKCTHQWVQEGWTGPFVRRCKYVFKCFSLCDLHPASPHFHPNGHDVSGPEGS
ncbi:hypothetical protein ABIA33_000392 [Streptacidiphilus sp. MAP12-16]